jgi:hypothetical protein
MICPKVRLTLKNSLTFLSSQSNRLKKIVTFPLICGVRSKKMYAAIVKSATKSIVHDYRIFWRNRFNGIIAINIMLLSAILEGNDAGEIQNERKEGM